MTSVADAGDGAIALAASPEAVMDRCPPIVTARRSALVLIAVMIALWAWHTEAAWRSARDNASQMVSALARTMEYQANTTIRSIDTLLQEAAQRIDPNHWPDPVLTPWFASRLAAFPEITTLVVLHADGRIAAPGLSPGGLLPESHDLSNREYFRYHLRHPEDRGLHIGDPIVGSLTHVPTIPLSRATVDAAGRMTGVVVAGIDPAALDRALAKLQIEDAGGISLIRSDGIFLARLPDPRQSFGGSVAASPLFRTFLRQAKVGVARFVSVTDGHAKFVAFRTLESYPLVATVGITEHTAFAGFHRETAWTLALMALVAAALYRLAAMADSREHARMVLAARLEVQSRALERQVAERTRHLEAARSEVEARARQLAASNAELERFAYVASHDLKTPLRSIISYSQLLDRRYRDRLDSDAAEFIGFIVDGGQRMSALLDDLLAYAMIENPGMATTAVAAAPALATALANLDAEIVRTGATITCGELPVVLANTSQLVSLFQNLIDNALKYRCPGRPIEISVGAHQVIPGEWRFAVTDNGIGIAPEFYGKVFEIFQRLEPVGHGEGTGIGLALCQHIVHRFGGTIWVDSHPGQGTTFYFSLRDGAAAPPT